MSAYERFPPTGDVHPVNMAKFSWPVGGRINCGSNQYPILLLLSRNSFDWQVYVSLLRMYLEPPNVSGKEVHRNITVALNVLQEHRQKIATAKVLFHYVTLQHFGGVHYCYALTWHFELARIDLNSWYFTFRVDQDFHTFEKNSFEWHWSISWKGSLVIVVEYGNK